ncbi:MAG: dipeptide epimerase, partial [Armatimonadetes bacterium]|nr:dipeptide epimerase [Armatimonadota bacterium]
PFATAQDTLARQVSRPVRLTLRLDDGLQAVGECVPVRYVTGETPETAYDALEAAAAGLIGHCVDRPVEALAAADRGLADTLGGPMRVTAPSAWAALEMAVYDGLCRARGMSAWSMFGGVVREVETDVTVPITPDAVDIARSYAVGGFRCFKVKLGRAEASDDLALLCAIRDAVPGALFRLDANQAFDADSALRFLDSALSAGLSVECFEQPVPKHDLPALDAVAARSPVPVFADEAVTSPEAALRIVSETRVHGINVKLMKSGIRGALDIAAIARAAGRSLMIGCMLETRRGIGWALALAAGSGGFGMYDLDSHMLLAEEMPDDGRRPQQAADLREHEGLTTGAVGSVVGFEQEGATLRVSPI